MTRRGFTLIELIIGLLLLAMLGVAMTTTLAAASRSASRALQALTASRTTTATATLLREELGSSGADEVVLATPTAVDFSRTIGAAAVCGVAGAVVQLRASEWLGVRDPEGGRDFGEVLTASGSGTWQRISIDDVGHGHCDDGSLSVRLTLAVAPSAALFVRVTEPVRLRQYLASGSGWWGLAPATGLSPVQPFAGPLDTPLQDATLAGSVLGLMFRATAGRDTLLRFPLGPP